MSLKIAVALFAVAIAAFALGAQVQRGAKVEASPHAAALELIFKTQQARIRAVDQENWWHDVKERSWVVRRPFAPGTIDSTHLFEVSYRIEGKTAASWLVDTRLGKVTEREDEARK
jgi:hypothetical protein